MDKVKKVTKAQRFEDIRAMLEGKPTTYGTDVDTALAFIDKELGLLAKKNGSNGTKKLTPLQVENNEHKERIVQFLMEHTDGETVTNIMKGIPEFADFSNQKVSRLCRDLADAQILRKDKDKGKTLFYLA